MQASKIKVGDVYAVKYNAITARFRVTKIVTQRTSRGTDNTIHGEIMDASPGKPAGVSVSYDPENIIGPYQEHSELVKRENELKERLREESARKAARAEAIFTAFCKLIGVPKPKKVKEYSTLKYRHDEPFRLDYSDHIEINSAGMEILATLFKVDEPTQEVSDNVVNLNTTS